MAVNFSSIVILTQGGRVVGTRDVGLEIEEQVTLSFSGGVGAM